MSPGPTIAISVDGRPVTCRAGVTIAAALIGAGEARRARADDRQIGDPVR